MIMIRNLRRLVVAPVALAVLGCASGSGATNQSSTPAATHQAAPHTAQPLNNTNPTIKSIVQIDFEGLIAHLVPQDGSTTDRAVVLRDDGSHIHNFVLKLPPTSSGDFGVFGDPNLVQIACDSTSG